MKYINAIFGIGMIIISIFMINREIAFESGIIIAIVSLVMLVLNTIECWKLYKNNNKEKFFKSCAMVFLCLVLVILGLSIVYNELLYLDILHQLEQMGIK